MIESKVQPKGRTGKSEERLREEREVLRPEEVRRLASWNGLETGEGKLREGQRGQVYQQEQETPLAEVNLKNCSAPQLKQTRSQAIGFLSELTIRLWVLLKTSSRDWS